MTERRSPRRSCAEHGLKPDEYERILSILGRAPNLVELGIFAVMWSEHCSYKSSRSIWLQAPDRGALGGPGPGRECRRGRHRRRPGRHLQDGEPQPPVASSSPTRVRRPASAASCATCSPWARGRWPSSTRCASASPSHPRTRHLVDGVVRGIGGYGNCVGVPTVGGECRLPPALQRQHPGQRDARRHRAAPTGSSYAPASGVGNPVVYVGAKTGRDGIHGATMASRRVQRRDRGQAPDGAGRRPVHREAADRGLPRADGDRRHRRHPGHGRGRADLVLASRWRRAAATGSSSTSTGCRCARPA